MTDPKSAAQDGPQTNAQSIGQPTSQSTSQSASEPASELASEPPSQPAASQLASKPARKLSAIPPVSRPLASQTQANATQANKPQTNKSQSSKLQSNKPRSNKLRVSKREVDQLRADLKKTNLYLVGMMGAGKTTIGRKLANRLSYRFVDTDTLIERSVNQKVSELFASEGETAFRELETQVLSQASTYTSMVVATGGGVVTQQMNWSYLHHGIVIWLDVPISILIARLSGDSSRPLLKGVDLSSKLTDLLLERGDLYAQADIRIGYEGKSVGRTCDRILKAIQANLRLDPKLAAGQIEINQTSINPVRLDT